MAEAGGQVMQGLSDWKTGKAQAAVALDEGKQALNAANYEATVIRRTGDETQSSNTVAAAGNGVDVNSQSALDIAMKNARDSELDALFAINKGQKINWAKGIEAKQAKKAGQLSLINSGIKAYSTMEKAVAKAVSAGGGGGG
jgi:hypothetical protein